eukprot:1310291-Alexandrium_andersonii.AAC.1
MWNSTNLDCTVRGPEAETFFSELEGLKKFSGALHKSLVALDIKIKKWSSPPQEVLDTVSARRSVAKAVFDAASAFAPGKNRDSNKMETAKMDLASNGLKVPLGLHCCFFEEKSADYIRFRLLVDFVEFLQPGGYLSEGILPAGTTLEDMDSDFARVRRDVCGEALATIARATKTGDTD